MNRIERNAKIAKFMNDEHSQHKYNESWDSLIPVVSKVFCDIDIDDRYRGILEEIVNNLQNLDIKCLYSSVLKYIFMLNPSITKADFIEWYFEDDHDYREAGHILYEYLEKGESMTIENLFNHCGYIEIDGIEYDTEEVELID